MSYPRLAVPVAITLSAFAGLLGAQNPAGRGAATAVQQPTAARAGAAWSTYNGGVDGDHFSSLTQINRANVRNLRQAWIYNTGERGSAHQQGGLETNPLVVGRTMFLYSPSQKVVALDAASGKVLWTFDAGISTEMPNRGMSYWTDGKDSRLLAAVGNHLFALDPKTGTPIANFGENGAIDLREDLGEADYTKTFVAMTSPGILYKDLIIVGFRAPEEEPAAHGDIRAYDVRTGQLRWTFHTIPRPGEPGYGTWPPDAWKTTAGSANNWAGMALDAKRGIVYVPTGSAVTDFYGYDRLGNDLFADSLLALDAATGKLLWYFQGVHHDIWDRDFPSPPALVTVKRNGRSVDAVAQTSKQGFVFLFNRVTGKPLFPIEERPFPPSDVPGEVASPTQPIPLAPAPYARQMLTADMLTQRTPEAHAWAVKQFSTFRSDGLFVPFSVNKQTIIFPGYDGGGEWGGPAVDPRTGVIYINSNDVAWTGGLTPNTRGKGPGEDAYLSQCSSCHGENRQGSPPAFPSLVGVYDTLGASGITQMVREGKGRMPSFPNIDDATLKDVIAFLRTPPHGTPTQPSEDASSNREPAPIEGTPEGTPKYRFTGYRKFLDPDGYPAIAPPWGTLNAIDLNTGKYLWKVPFGQYPALAAIGMGNTGSENYGGPVITASGLLFIGATVYDHKIRAFDTRTGKVLWEASLPYSGVATPATYMVDGKQYIVIGASGQREPKGPQGASYVAFTLP